MGNQRHCYALTITDNFSRYLLLCQALERPSYAAVRPWFEWVFRQYGFPQAIRTDNGAPPLLRSRSADSVSCRNGGFSWVSVLSGSNRVSRAKTDVMNGCTERSNTRWRPNQRKGANSIILTAFRSSITGNVPMKL